MNKPTFLDEAFPGQVWPVDPWDWRKILTAMPKGTPLYTSTKHKTAKHEWFTAHVVVMGKLERLDFEEHPMYIGHTSKGPAERGRYKRTKHLGWKVSTEFAREMGKLLFNDPDWFVGECIC